MAKDPAFLFYPGDWIGGTMLMSRSHKGAYMDLLMAQFNNGHLTLDGIKFILGSDYDLMWESVLSKKFILDDKSLYYNDKLQREIDKRRKFVSSRVKNLEQHKECHTATHTDVRMENGNENVNESVIKDKKGIVKGKIKSRYTELAESIYNYYNDQIKTIHKTKGRACYNIQKLIDSGKTEEYLKTTIDNYKSKALTGDPDKRKDCSNFFGEDGVFLGYENKEKQFELKQYYTEQEYNEIKKDEFFHNKYIWNLTAWKNPQGGNDIIKWERKEKDAGINRNFKR